MTIKQIREALNMGCDIVDIGQIQPDGRAYLRKLVKLGLVEVETSNRFPQPKRAYVACDLIPEVAA